MVNKIEYIVLNNYSLIIETYIGNFNLDELIEFKKKVGNDKNYNPIFNVIHDFRKAKFIFGIEEISKNIILISKKNKLLANQKLVMLTNTPNQVVTCLGFELLKDEFKLPVQVKVCSTLETCFNFIELPDKEYEFIESFFNSIKD
ncbi:hypothetical protein [Lutibacter sp.]|uniref:hypothetical protein n=1 Tax=Lutibacter sp. TaxID=1925666 RepID=UPI001A1858C7|nr:hypothetical protein [Lutibacter sp.]MBI9040779.1 hypothetical protein [Lutibacter sp.]